jgi:hypothetical protein
LQFDGNSRPFSKALPMVMQPVVMPEVQWDQQTQSFVVLVQLVLVRARNAIHANHHSHMH